MRYLGESVVKRIVGATLSAVLVFGMTPAAWADDSASSLRGSGSSASENTSDTESASTTGGSRIVNVIEVEGDSDDTTSDDQSSKSAAEIAADAVAATAEDTTYASDYQVALSKSAADYGTQELVSNADAVQQSCDIAKRGWSSCDQAILIPADGAGNALSALALAGTLSCPVLVVNGDDSLDALTSTLSSLGVKQVLTVGKNAAFTDTLYQRLTELQATITPLTGVSEIDAQLAVYDYGRQQNLWRPGEIYLASSATDQTAAGALVYSSHTPVFSTLINGHLRPDQKEKLGDVTSLSATTDWKLTALGDDATVSDAAVREAMFALQSTPCHVEASRITETDSSQLSLQIAQTLVAQGAIGWNGLAVALPGDVTSSVCAACAQTYAGRPLVLVNDDTVQSTAEYLEGKGIDDLVYLNNGPGVSSNIQNILSSHMGFSQFIYESMGSLSTLANAQVDNLASIYGYDNVSKTEIMENMDANAVEWGDPAFYQFAVLSDGYSGAITAEELDAWIDANAPSNSMFKGAGKYFIAAAQHYNVNEVYLLAHAALESAWGSSTLATGGIDGYAGCYNFFGVGAYDSNPSNGAVYAADHGWTSVGAAVMGAAEFITDEYVNDSSDQNTLYYMRWNVKHGASHQYASSPLWAGSIAKLMAQCYEMNGISMANSGLRFLIPVYE